MNPIEERWQSTCAQRRGSQRRRHALDGRYVMPSATSARRTRSAVAPLSSERRSIVAAKNSETVRLTQAWPDPCAHPVFALLDRGAEEVRLLEKWRRRPGLETSALVAIAVIDVASKPYSAKCSRATRQIVSRYFRPLAYPRAVIDLRRSCASRAKLSATLEKWAVATVEK